jgi:hypothetical protein
MAKTGQIGIATALPLAENYVGEPSSIFGKDAEVEFMSCLSIQLR